MNRHVVPALAGFALVFLGIAAPIENAMGQNWPQRSVKLILPLGAGSGLDFTARIFADRLSARWGQPVVVENRPGGDAIVAISAFVGANDDHVLLLAASGMFTPHPFVHEKLPYDARRDILPIAGLTSLSVGIAVTHSLKVNSLAELVSLARAQPGKLNWASITSIDEFKFAGFLKEHGLSMSRIPYRDTVQALNDLSEGRIDVATSALSLTLPRVQAGKAKLLAVLNQRRSPLVPDVPTTAEAGYPAIFYDPILGLFGPSRISPQIRERIVADLRIVAEDPAIGPRLAPAGQVVNFMPSAEFAATIERERESIAAIVQVLGIKPTQ